jgi:putative nucleotidyltransferase with HDIG domain
MRRIGSHESRAPLLSASAARPTASALDERAPAARRVLPAGRHLDMLPPPSTTLTYVLEVVSNPRLSCSDLAEMIASDATLVTELLRAANSAYYGVSARVTSVAKAVVILGTRRALSLAVGAAAFSAMSRVWFPRGFDHQGLWNHLRATAIAARWLVEPVHPGEADTAYIAGLLHDIGKAAYVLVRSDDWQRIQQDTRDPNVTFHAAEQAVGGASHVDIGGELLECWKLPETLSRIVRCHHSPEALEGVEARLAMAVRTADAVARIAGIGNPGDRNVPSPESLVDARAGAGAGAGAFGTSDDLQRLVQRLHGAATLFDEPRREGGAA